MNYKILLILGTALILMPIIITVVILILVSGSEPQHIGIIGGADKPTAIFLVSEFKFVFLAFAVELLAGIGCIIAALKIKRKNDRGNKD